LLKSAPASSTSMMYIYPSLCYQTQRISVLYERKIIQVSMVL